MYVVKNLKDVTIVKVQHKKLELIDCLILKRIINSASSQKNRDIIIDLVQVKSLCNNFVEKMLNAQKHCEINDCTIAFCGVNHNILSIFYLLKLDKYFEFYENEKEALLRENRFIQRRFKVV